MAGRAADCVASSDAAIAMANEFGIEEEAARVLQYRGVARTELGDLGGLDDLRESIERLRGAPALSTAIGLLNLADATWLAVGAEEGLELHLQQQRFCVSRGVTGSYWWSKAESTWMFFDLGRWDELLATVEEVAGSGRRRGTAGTRAWAPLSSARPRPPRGRCRSCVERRGRPAEGAGVRDLQLSVPRSCRRAGGVRQDDGDTALVSCANWWTSRANVLTVIARCSCPSSPGCARRPTPSTSLTSWPTV